jgi:hypothetical protein
MPILDPRLARLFRLSRFVVLGLAFPPVPAPEPKLSPLVASSTFIHPTKPSSTSCPLPVFQSATKRLLHFSRRVPGGVGAAAAAADDDDREVDEDDESGVKSWTWTASSVAGVGGREQTRRPQTLQWCFLLARVKPDLSV